MTTRKESVAQITEMLKQGVSNVFTSEQYKNYLDTMERFHKYSVNNSILIFMQKPQATAVAGYTSWKKNFGRTVNPGEHGIRIMAPAPYKRPVTTIDESTGEQKTTDVIIEAYKPVYVFDYSQTSGKPLPRLGVEELKGNVDRYEEMREAIIAISPCAVRTEDFGSSAKGYYSLKNNEIVIKPGMAEMQTLKTLVHEEAHATLHTRTQLKDEQKDSHTREVEAESVAYIVCKHFGIDTSDYSFGYIAGWSKGHEPKELLASLETIRTTAGEMIAKVEMELAKVDSEKRLSEYERLASEVSKVVRDHDPNRYYANFETYAVVTEEAYCEALNNLKEDPVTLMGNLREMYYNAADDEMAKRIDDLIARIESVTGTAEPAPGLASEPIEIKSTTLSI